MKKETKLFKGFRLFLSARFCIFAIMPIYSALIVSLTPYGNVLEAQLFPHYFEWINYVDAFKLILRKMLNSFMYASVATILTTTISVPAAYAIARYRFAMRKTVKFILLLTQMMAGIVILPALYKLFHALGMLNSIWSLVFVYTAVNMALVVTIHEGYFAALPRAVDEAAEIDGATAMQTFVKIVLPISMTIIAVIGLYAAVGYWNAYKPGLMYIRDDQLFPLQVVLRELLLVNMNDMMVVGNGEVEQMRKAEQIKYGIIVVSTLPIMCLYPMLQRFFAKGVMIGAVKG